VAELTSGGFREVLPDTAAIDPEQVTRVVFCSGKIYYDLLAAREARQANHVALVRIEQLYPFAESDANDALMRYPLTAEVVWAQEEPRNMGPWRFMQEQLQPLLRPRPRVALCGPSGKRQPGDRIGHGGTRRSRRPLRTRRCRRGR
jgi:2-oxoglutarate dehydrogenase complex dehydrogenase (E1) component-like enzyme